MSPVRMCPPSEPIRDGLAEWRHVPCKLDMFSVLRPPQFPVRFRTLSVRESAAELSDVLCLPVGVVVSPSEGVCCTVR